LNFSITTGSENQFGVSVISLPYIFERESAPEFQRNQLHSEQLNNLIGVPWEI
jgi:hypothetical protein